MSSIERYQQFVHNDITARCAAEGLHYETPNLPMVRLTMLDQLPWQVVRWWVAHWNLKLKAARTQGDQLAARAALELFLDDFSRRRSIGEL